MSALVIAAILVLVGLTLALTLREQRPNPIAVLLCLGAVTACAGFTGFVVSDVRTSYIKENIDRAIDETHQLLIDGQCEAVTRSYERAINSRDFGGDPYQTLHMLVRELRDVPDAQEETSAGNDTP